MIAKKLLLLLLAMGMTACQFQEPKSKLKARPGRATWNTGYFQEALVRRGLVELGYEVEQPKELTNPIFYKSLALGDLDYWVNGWFPNHNAQTPKNNRYMCPRLPGCE